MASRSTNCSNSCVPERRHSTSRPTVDSSDGTRSRIGPEWLPHGLSRTQMVSLSAAIRRAPPPQPSCGGCGCPTRRARQECHRGGRAHLVVRVIEYPGNMHQAGTHSPSMTEGSRQRLPKTRRYRTEMLGTCLSSDGLGRPLKYPWRGMCDGPTVSSRTDRRSQRLARPSLNGSSMPGSHRRPSPHRIPPRERDGQCRCIVVRAEDISPRPASGPSGPCSHPGRPDQRGRRPC